MNLAPDEKPVEKIHDKDRWIAAISYIPIVCLYSLTKVSEGKFIKFHASQGFLLFLAEVVVVILTIILELTIGKIRFLGIFVVGLFQLGTGLIALLLAVIGFVKSLFGEYWHIPLLGDHIDKVPGFQRKQV